MIQDSQLKHVHNLNVESLTPLLPPQEVLARVLMSEKSVETTLNSRRVVSRILDGSDKRKFLIVGPCSIHDPNAAMEYARKLQDLAYYVQDELVLIMRTYFEKPRTTVGWKGFINDPFLNNTFQMDEGILRARQLLCDITSLGVPVATEALDPFTPQYLSGLVTWTAIGARTTESQTHREMASGLSSPVGFKNNTDGNIQVAINAMKSAMRPHRFVGLDAEGRISMVATTGNRYCHLILRGGGGRPNYDSVSVQLAERALSESGIRANIVVDCSHDNSNKDYKLQSSVLKDCLYQILQGATSLVGFMIESNLFEGSQPISDSMRYGVSITDPCVGFEETKDMILKTHSCLKQR